MSDTKAFLLQVKYLTYLEKGAMSPGEEVETVEKWEPQAVFANRARACEYAYDLGIIEFKIAEIDLNPTREPRRY